MQRRTLLRGGTAALAAALWPEQGRASATGASTAQIARTRLILLGTGGGPRPRATTSAPSQVVVANGTPYVIDCGDGVARQLVFAGVPLTTLRHVFVTHKLVLSHLVPPDDPGVTDQMWIGAARKHFDGTIVLGRDLMEL